MSSAQEAPPDGGDRDRGPTLVAVIWVLSAIDIVFVAGRFWGRRIQRSTGWDDWTMLFTLVLYLVHNSILSFDALHGGQRHLFYLSSSQVSEALRYNWLAQPFMVFGFATGKISVGLLLLRLSGPDVVWRKWVIYFAMVSATLFSAINIILTYVQCDKVQALWEPQLIEEGIAHCWPTQIQTDFAIFLGSWNAVIDALLALLPITIFWSVQMTIREKLALCALLGLGLIAAICSAVKTQYLATLNQRSDFTWETYDLFVWSIAELFVIIACGSVPPMKPIWDRNFRRAKQKMTQYNAGKTKEYGSTYAYGSTYLTATTESSYLDKSKMSASRNFSRSHSYGYGHNHPHAEDENETRFELEGSVVDTPEEPNTDRNREVLAQDAMTRFEVWRRDGRFPVGPQYTGPHDRYNNRPQGPRMAAP